jgi:hypothetical protein
MGFKLNKYKETVTKGIYYVTASVSKKIEVIKDGKVPRAFSDVLEMYIEKGGNAILVMKFSGIEQYISEQVVETGKVPGKAPKTKKVKTAPGTKPPVTKPSPTKAPPATKPPATKRTRTPSEFEQTRVPSEEFNV